MQRIKVIANPISGRGTGAKSIPIIRQLLQDHELEFDLVQTERPWHAAELAQEAAASGYDCVVAAGGDGTANEVLNGLMGVDTSRRPTMGIICVGRGNDFAFSMGIPVDLEAGCLALAQGKSRTIDVGRVTGGEFPDGRYFGNGVGIGFDAMVGFVAQEMTWLHGFASYLVAALKTIFLYFQAPHVEIAYNDQTLTRSALMVSIMNGRRMGGGFMMAPDGLPDDGRFDLCIANQVSRPRIFSLILRFMNGTQGDHPAITTALSSKVRVTALNGVLPAHADGETLCTAGEQLELELLPGQVNLIVGHEEACQ